jgi:hypothetical protein
MNILSHLAAKHWLVGGIAVSLIWFLAGRQSISNRRADAAVFWQAVAVMIGLIVCGWAIVEKEWLGLIAAIAVVFFEARSITRSTLWSFFRRAR